MGRIKNGLLGVFGNVYGGRSLEQMTLTDKDSPNGDPILLHMSLPGERLASRGGDAAASSAAVPSVHGVKVVLYCCTPHCLG